MVWSATFTAISAICFLLKRNQLQPEHLFLDCSGQKAIYLSMSFSLISLEKWSRSHCWTRFDNINYYVRLAICQKDHCRNVYGTSRVFFCLGEVVLLYEGEAKLWYALHATRCCRGLIFFMSYYCWPLSEMFRWPTCEYTQSIIYKCLHVFHANFL